MGLHLQADLDKQTILLVVRKKEVEIEKEESRWEIKEKRRGDFAFESKWRRKALSLVYYLASYCDNSLILNLFC